MKLSTGRWVSGDDFFDREDELKLLESLVCDGNHVLLTGQRRMGKTSVARELGRRLQDKGWVFLFTDVEGATCPEDVIARIAEAAHPVRPISSAFAAAMTTSYTTRRGSGTGWMMNATGWPWKSSSKQPSGTYSPRPHGTASNSCTPKS